MCGPSGGSPPRTRLAASTPWSCSWRGAVRIRTGVNGFAGRCVATPPRRRVRPKGTDRHRSSRSRQHHHDGALATECDHLAPRTSATGGGCSPSLRGAGTTLSSRSTSWPRPMLGLSTCGGASGAIPQTRRRWRRGSSESVAPSYIETLRRGAAERRDLRRVGVVAPALDAEELRGRGSRRAAGSGRHDRGLRWRSSRRGSARWYSWHRR